MGKFNPITGQYESDYQTVATTTSTKRKKFNPITGQYEDEDLTKSQSSIGGLQPTNIFKKEKSYPGTMISSPLQDPNKNYSILDVLGVGQYAGAKFFDGLLDGENITEVARSTFSEIGKVLNSTVKASVFGGDEEIIPPERLSYKDVIKNAKPEFAQNYPVATSVLGFVGDIALDPTTYISFGTTTGAKLAGRKLSNEGIDLVRSLNTIAQDGFKVTIRNKQGLERIANFGIDEITKLNETHNIVALSKDVMEGDKAALTQLNFIINQQTKGFKGKIVDVSELTPAARNWTVESNFLSMARDNPKLLQEGGDTGLFINIPFSPKRITVIPPKYIDNTLEKLGLGKVTSAIEERLKDNDIVQAFARTYPMPEEYLKLRDTLYGQLNVVDHSLMTSIRDFSSLPRDSRQKLADLAIIIDQRILQKKELLPEGGFITDKVRDLTRQFHMNKSLADGLINQDEFNAFGKFIESHNRLADLEMSSRLFKQSKGLFFTKDIASKGGEATLDLAVLHALKIKAAGYKQAHNDFDEGLKLLYGVEKDGKIISFTPPKAVQKDLDFIGQSTFSSKLNQAKHPILDALGKFNNSFKFLAYAIRPAAAIKQYVGNTLQSYSKIGVAAFKTFDPRSIIDAAVMIADNSSFSKIIPSGLIEGLQRFETPVGKMIYAVDKFQPALVKDFTMVGRLGEKITGPQLAEELMTKDIYHKGMDILSLEQDKNIRLQIAKANGFVAFQKEKWQEGFRTFIKESIPWINLPSHVENMNRVSLYINARRLGMDADNAARLTKKGLFDYHHGTTAFENTFAKRIVPFYTFQRFAIPLVASLIKEPGKAATLNKITKEFFEVYNLVASDQQLTDSQREVLPGYLVEQPNVFAGYDNGIVKKGIFRTFNSYIFTDWLSMIQPNIDGSIDMGKTVQKMTLAQITPILKVPLELLYKKNFFTDAPIAPDGGAKIASGQAVEFYEKNIPDLAKHLMGYEVRTDQQTGEKRGYINPYITYTMNSFAPFLSDYVNIGKYDLNARESAMKLFAGVGTAKLDFQKEQHYRIKEWQDKVKELQYQIRLAMMAGKQDVVNEEQQQLQELIKKISGVANLNVQ